MKKSKFSESQIIKALKENEQGRSVGDLSRELGIDKSTFYYWRKKYGGMEQQQLKRLKELEEEYDDKEVLKPEYWGGYRVSPIEFEFWQGRPNRLHDRIQYKLVDNDWAIERLQP